MTNATMADYLVPIAGTLLRPLKAARQPTMAELLRAGMECLDPTIKEDFASWLHWNVQLEA